MRVKGLFSFGFSSIPFSLPRIDRCNFLFLLYPTVPQFVKRPSLFSQNPLKSFFRKSQGFLKILLTNRLTRDIIPLAFARYRKSVSYAGMAELADALDSGSSESNFMQVQVLFPAPNRPELVGFSYMKKICMRSDMRLKPDVALLSEDTGCGVLTFLLCSFTIWLQRQEVRLI